MADNMQTLGLDASDLIAELTKTTAAFKAHNAAIEEVAIGYVEYNKKGEAVKATGQMILDSGQAIDIMLKRNKGSWDSYVTGIDNATRAMKDSATAQQMLAGAGGARMFMPDATGMKSSILDAFRTVQQDLAKALGADPANQKIAEEIFAKLKVGVVEVEAGIRGKIQGALLDVLRLSERINAEQAKMSAARTPPPPPGPAGMNQQDLGTLRQQITQIYPPVPGATLSSIAQYQASINSLLQSVARGKLTMQEFAGLFNKVSQNPTGDFAGTNQQLAAVQANIQKVIIAYNGMGQSAQQAGQSGAQAGRSLFVSFEQFVKLLEVQIIHRIFGNLITEIQQSISKAAELRVKISEVMTVSQGSNFSESGMAEFIRQRSEMFNRPQSDVTEGLYQAFSNQIIRSSADLQVFDQALRLSRITVSTVADSVNLLSSVMRSYNQTNVQAEATVNALFKAVELGRFRVSDLADTFGRISVVGAQAGVQVNELLAILAHLSITGLRPAEAETQISAIMNSFMRPSQEMRNVLRSWGFESGESAIRILTLTGAIARLNQEVLSGRHNLSELTPNIRAIRGITGARDTGEIGNIQRQLDQSGPSANVADQLVGQNVGTRFQQEVEKIRNMFLGLGETVMKELERLAAPWGGISSAVKDSATAIGTFVQAGMMAVSAINALASLIKPLGGDLGTLIKLWVDYKVAMMAWSAVSTIVTAAQSMYTSLEVQAAAATSTSTGSIVLNRLARYTTAAATTAQTGALAVNSGAQLANTAATATATAGQVALAGATRLASLALAASPIILVAVAVAALTGQLDGLINKLNGVEQAMNRIEEVGKVASAAIRGNIEESNRALAEREQQFERTVRRAEQTGGAVFAELTRRATEVTEAQRNLVATTTENLRVSMRGISDEMQNVLADLNRRISETRRYSQESLRRGASFADRDATDNFRRQLEALTQRPNFIQPIGTQDYAKQDQERLKYDVERQQHLMGQQLIQQRINTLQVQAADLVRNGDEESMQSARRRFEEIRRLTEDSFNRQTNFNRRTAEHGILMGTGMTDANGIARYNVPIQQLQQDLQRLTDLENAAEAAHRRRIEAGRAVAQEQLTQERVRQQLLNDSIRQFEQFQVMEANSGRLRERYRGENGLQNLNTDWARMRQQFEQATQGGNFSPEARLQAMTALLQQYGALRGQIERENASTALQNEQNLFNQRLENVRRLRAEATRTEAEFNANRQTVVDNTTRNLTAMMEQANNAVRLITGRARNSPLLSFEEQSRIDTAADRFRQTVPAVTDANAALANARTVEEQRVAMERLATAIAAADRAYRDLFGLAGARNLQNSPLTGDQIRNQQTALAQNAEALQTHFNALQRSREQLQAAEQTINALQNQIDRAAQQMGPAIQLFNNLGGAAGQQVAPVNNFAESVRRLADQLDRLRNAPAIPAPGIAPAAPAAFNDEGFAGGGLIGGKFNSFGPDDRLASVRTGEFVINPESTSRFYSQLVAINSGRMPSFAKGGEVGGSSVTNVGDISISVHDSGDPNATARAVLGTLRRELRRGNGRL